MDSRPPADKPAAPANGFPKGASIKKGAAKNAPPKKAQAKKAPNAEMFANNRSMNVNASPFIPIAQRTGEDIAEATAISHNSTPAALAAACDIVADNASTDSTEPSHSASAGDSVSNTETVANIPTAKPTYSDELLHSEGIMIRAKPPLHGTVATFRTDVCNTYINGWEPYLESIMMGKPRCYILSYIFKFGLNGKIIKRRFVAQHSGHKYYEVFCENSKNVSDDIAMRGRCVTNVAKTVMTGDCYAITFEHGRPTSGFLDKFTGSEYIKWPLKSCVMHIIRVM